MRTLLRPVALMLEPSAVRTSSGSITVNLVNFERSGQKWVDAPESMMAPRDAAGILSWSAMLHKSEVVKAYSTVLVVAALFWCRLCLWLPFRYPFLGPCHSLPP